MSPRALKKWYGEVLCKANHINLKVQSNKQFEENDWIHEQREL